MISSEKAMKREFVLQGSLESSETTQEWKGDRFVFFVNEH